MKQIILLISIFVLGGVAYAFLNPLLLTLLQKEDTVATTTADILVPPTPQKTETIPVEKKTEVATEDTVTIAPDGSQLDGPFIIYDAEGNKTDATVQIVRSPEETLVQFENVTKRYPETAVIYFAEEKQPKEYLNIGSVKFKEKVYIYGVPLDVDLSNYTYVLIYDMEENQALSYAKIN